MTIGSIVALTKIKHFPSKWSLVALQRLETYPFWATEVRLFDLLVSKRAIYATILTNCLKK